MGNSSRALWKLPEMSVETDGANMGSIRARFSLGSSGTSSPTTITAHFGCDGSTMSGAEMELVSPGYRTSLVKRRFVAGKLSRYFISLLFFSNFSYIINCTIFILILGKYLCDAEVADVKNRYAAPPGPTSTEC